MALVRLLPAAAGAALLLLLLLLPSAAAADPVDRWSPHIVEASQRFGVPPDWIRRVIRTESGGQAMIAGKPAVSPAGAMGLMQLMPRTWSEMRLALGLGSDPHDPRDNILAGTFYLRLMYDRFGYPGLFGAYNAGPRRFADHVEGRRALPRETRLYVGRIAGPDQAAMLGPKRPDAVAAAKPRIGFMLPRRPAALFAGRDGPSVFVTLTGSGH